MHNKGPLSLSVPLKMAPSPLKRPAHVTGSQQSVPNRKARWRFLWISWTCAIKLASRTTRVRYEKCKRLILGIEIALTLSPDALKTSRQVLLLQLPLGISRDNAQYIPAILMITLLECVCVCVHIYAANWRIEISFPLHRDIRVRKSRRARVQAASVNSVFIWEF